MNLLRWTLPLGLIALLSGCGGSRESKLIGHWKPRPGSVLANTLRGAMSGAGSGQPAAASAQATQAMARTTIDIRDDKTFTLTVDAPIDGTWTFDENNGTADMTITKVNGQAVTPTPGQPTTPTFTAQLDSDNTMLTLKASGSAGVGPAVGLNGLNFEKGD